MLKKIVTIKSVGRFKNYGANGDVELKRFSLFFAENGRGKTTLCSILRSLQSSTPGYVIGRKTLGSTDPQEIRILLDTGPVTFSNGAWSRVVPEIVIYDSTFISENVFSGDTVDIEHKRNLYRVIVGSDGVKLAARIDALDAASRSTAAEIREKSGALRATIPTGIDIDAFLKLEDDPNIDDKLREMQKELATVRQADDIRARQNLSPITVAGLPTGFAALLARTLNGIAKDVEQKVAKQIELHGMHSNGRGWLSEGLTFVKHDKCPFCAQDIRPAASLMEAYTAYFSESYRALVDAIGTMRTEIERTLGDRHLATWEKGIDTNTAGWTFGHDFARYLILGGRRMRGIGSALCVKRRSLNWIGNSLHPLRRSRSIRRSLRRSKE
jgi:wobble nucleotide-excising tRNase